MTLASTSSGGNDPASRAERSLCNLAPTSAGSPPNLATRAYSANRIAEGDSLSCDGGRFLDRHDRIRRETQPRRPRGRGTGERGSALGLDQRHTSSAIGEAVEPLELGSRWWLPLREDTERPANAILARIDELPSDRGNGIGLTRLLHSCVSPGSRPKSSR